MDQKKIPSSWRNFPHMKSFHVSKSDGKFINKIITFLSERGISCSIILRCWLYHNLSGLKNIHTSNNNKTDKFKIFRFWPTRSEIILVKKNLFQQRSQRLEVQQLLWGIWRKRFSIINNTDINIKKGGCFIVFFVLVIYFLRET